MCGPGTKTKDGTIYDEIRIGDHAPYASFPCTVLGDCCHISVYEAYIQAPHPAALVDCSH